MCISAQGRRVGGWGVREATFHSRRGTLEEAASHRHRHFNVTVVGNYVRSDPVEMDLLGPTS